MTELELQAQVADYIRLQYPTVIFHSDFGSGIKLTMGQAIKQKRLNGGRRAWPDLFIAEPIYEEVEEWKPITGYQGFYEISDHGRVARVDKGKRHEIKVQINPKNGYCYAHLCKNGKVKALRVHRIVAEHFIEKREEATQVNHKDGNKANNMYTNLEWTTPSENQTHRYRVLGKDGGGRPKKQVRCVETGLVYKSIAEAERQTGIWHIRQAVIGERKSAGGFTWQEL